MTRLSYGGYGGMAKPGLGDAIARTSKADMNPTAVSVMSLGTSLLWSVAGEVDAY
jgi:hypothetical protein